MTQTNGEIFHVYGLEELILSKCPYYTKQSTDSMQSQNTNRVFHKTRTNNTKICMEPKKTLNSQSRLEKEERGWRYHNPRFQDILQSCSNQNNMVLAKIDT